MTHNRKTFAIAGILAASLAAPTAQAMQQELNAVTGAVYNELNARQMDLANIQMLTLMDIQKTNTIMHSGGGEGERKRQIDAILRKAGERQ